jgi:HEPN domain-containing protein
MDSERDVDFRLRLADGFLGEARDDVTRARWRSCVDNAQLAVENAVKAVIARFVPVPRTHDLVTPLDGLLASGRLTPGERDALVELRDCASDPGYEQHVRSDYGEEAAFKTPWEIFDAADAGRAMTIAERSVTLARSMLGRAGR